MKVVSVRGWLTIGNACNLRMKIVEGKNSQNTTSFLSRKTSSVIVRSKLNRIFHTLLTSCVERFLPRHDAFSFPDSILPGEFNTLRLNNCKCGVTFTLKILVSRSVALCWGVRVVWVFFLFFRGERIEIPSEFQLVLSIYSFGRPSTSFVPARKNHFLLPLSKITLPERDDSMQEHFKQRHCSNTWSNKLI